MSNVPLFSATIEPDEEPALAVPSGSIGGAIGSGSKPASSTRQPELLVPGTRADGSQGGAGMSSGAELRANASAGDAEMGIAGILRSSSHPLSLACLYLFRSAALAVYVLCGLFTDNYVLSIVIVVVLLSLDFWNVRNVAGRTLVGLRYWNEVDEDGESSWVFECRDPSRPANPIDEKMFWIALYVFPLGWLALFFVSLLKFSVSFLPIVALALVFNFSNALGFTYADRDARRRWATNAASGFASGIPGLGQLGGFGGQLLGGAVRSGFTRMLG